MSRERDHANGWVCADCMTLEANGDLPAEMSEAETAEYLARVDASGDWSLGRLVGEEGCNCQTWDNDEHREGCERDGFSRARCDACRTDLAWEILARADATR